MAGIAVLEAPSALGLVPGHRGVEGAPARLLEEGIADRLGAVVADGSRLRGARRSAIPRPR